VEAWKLVIEGNSGRDEARSLTSVFVDALRAQGHTVRQVTFYGDVGAPGQDLTHVPVPQIINFDAEDAEDVAAATEALAESDERIPFEQVKADLGMTEEPAP